MDKITGCVEFKNNKERKRLFVKIKEEFRGNVEIKVQDKFMFYTSIVNRNFL